MSQDCANSRWWETSLSAPVEVPKSLFSLHHCVGSRDEGAGTQLSRRKPSAKTAEGALQVCLLSTPSGDLLHLKFTGRRAPPVPALFLTPCGGCKRVGNSGLPVLLPVRSTRKVCSGFLCSLSHLFSGRECLSWLEVTPTPCKLGPPSLPLSFSCPSSVEVLGRRRWDSDLQDFQFCRSLSFSVLIPEQMVTLPLKFTRGSFQIVSSTFLPGIRLNLISGRWVSQHGILARFEPGSPTHLLVVFLLLRSPEEV